MRLFRLLFSRRNRVSSAAREMALTGHAHRRAIIRARCDEMRADMGMEPVEWPQ